MKAQPPKQGQTWSEWLQDVVPIGAKCNGCPFFEEIIGQDEGNCTLFEEVSNGYKTPDCLENKHLNEREFRDGNERK